MPYRKRYRDYEKAIRILKAQPGGDGTPLKEYKDFREGLNHANKPATPTPRQKPVRRILLPFGLSATADKAIIKVSGRAISSISNTGLNDGNLNIAVVPDPLPAENAPEYLRGFEPAKIIVFTKTSQERTTVKAGTTKIDYKRYQGETRSFPYGQGAAGSSQAAEFGMQSYLLGKLNANSSATFKPERMYRNS